jgi:serine phosphatase RsbU (regulator of sigma subunit)
VRLASAGHFLPILVSAGGDAETVDVPVGLPLGVDPEVRRTSGEVRLDPGDALVLFTDGLLERRTHTTDRSQEVFATIDTALAALISVLRPADAETIASRVLDSMLTIEPPGDDVALLVVRREPAV